VPGLFVQRQRYTPLTADNRRQPAVLLLRIALQVQQRTAEYHAGKQRRSAKVATDGLKNRPQALAAEIQATEVLGKRNRAPAQCHGVLPQLRVKAARLGLIAQGALARYRAARGKELTGTVGQHALIFVVKQVHGEFPYFTSGRPRTRLAITLSCTSDEPPEMVRAKLFSQPRVMACSWVVKVPWSQPSA